MHSKMRGMAYTFGLSVDTLAKHIYVSSVSPNDSHNVFKFIFDVFVMGSRKRIGSDVWTFGKISMSQRSTSNKVGL
jgi:hypothetical protein